jgi:hypothetical protein
MTAKSPATAMRRGERRLGRKSNDTTGFVILPLQTEESKDVHKFENDFVTVSFTKKKRIADTSSSESSSSEDKSEDYLKVIEANSEPRIEIDLT